MPHPASPRAAARGLLAIVSPAVGRRSLVVAAHAAAAVVMLACPTRAANVTWNAGSGSWATGTNWVGGAVPVAADAAVFGATDQTSDITVTLDGDQTIAGLTFGDANTLSGANWAVASGSPATSALTLSGTVNVNLPATQPYWPGQSVTISAPLASPTGFAKLGSGLLTLSGSNTISGTVVIGGTSSSGGYQGALRVTNGAALGSATVRQPGESLTLQPLELAGGITLGNTLQTAGKTGGHTSIRNVSGANTYTGTTRVTSSAGIGVTLEAAGGTFTFAGLLTSSTVANREVTLSGAADGNLAGVVSGSFTKLNKFGVGTWTLSGTSAITNNVSINGGTLRLDGRSGSFGTFGSQVIFGNSVTAGYTGAGSLEYVGAATGSILNVGSVRPLLGDSSMSSIYGTSGTTGITASGLQARPQGATLNFVTSGGSNGTTNKIAFTSGTNLLLNPGMFFNGGDYAIADAAGFVRGIAYGSDAGSVTTAGAATVSGTYVQITGDVTAQATATFQTLKVSGGANLTLGDGQAVTVNGILKSGVGAATISGGSGIQAASGQELVVRADRASDSITIATPILANGTGNYFTKSGAGTVTLSASNTLSGDVSVNAGTLAVAGSLPGNGSTRVMPGGRLVVTGTINPAAATNTGDLQVANAPGNAVVEINGGTINVGSSPVSIGNAAGGNGALVVNAGAFNLNTSSLRNLVIGNGGQIGTPSYGGLSVTGGSVSIGGQILAGSGANGVGVITVSGGAVATNGAYEMQLGATAADAAGSSIGVMTVTGGTVASTNASISGLSVAHAGLGTLTVSGSGAVVLGGAAGNSGLVLANNNLTSVGIVNLGDIAGGGGTISTNRVAKGSGTGIFNFHGGTLQARSLVANSTFMSGLTAAYIYGGGATIDTNGQNITISQPLLAPTGNGVTSIAVTGGAGYIAPPAVVLAGGGGIGATAVATIDAGGNLTGITVTNPGTDYTSAPAVTLVGGGGAGAVVGQVNFGANTSGPLTKIGSGTLSLTGSNSYTGITTISAGRLVGNTVSLRGQIVNNGTLEFNQNSPGTLAATITGSGAFVKSGFDTLTLSGSQPFPGGIEINGGGLALGSAEAIGSSGTISFTGGRLQYTASNTTDYSSRFSTGTNQRYNIDTNGQSVTLAAALTSSGGSLTKSGSGTLTLTGSNTYTGGTTLSAGVLALGSADAVGSSGTISFTSGTLQFSAANTTDYSGRFVTTPFPRQRYAFDTNGQTVTFANGLTSGSGSLTKSGAGNLILAGTSIFTGTTTVTAGRLSVNGALGTTPVFVQAAAELGGSGSIGGPVSVASGGTLAPGSGIASLATGTATFAANATFAYEVDSRNLSSLSTAADLFVVNGNLTLDPANGTLLTFADLNNTPAVFDPNTTIFSLINYSGAWNGGLFTYNGTPLADGGRFSVGGQEWEIDYNASSGGLNFTTDYLPSSSFVNVIAVTVPEPTTLVLAGSAAAIGLIIRRKRA